MSEVLGITAHEGLREEEVEKERSIMIKTQERDGELRKMIGTEDQDWIHRRRV